jgi:hypothetical protein
MSEKTLTGEEVLMIKRTNLVRPYKSETEGFEGKSYRVFAFGSEAFAVHEEDAFNKDFEDGNLKSVLITVTEDGWSLANHLTWNRAIAHKRHQIVFDSITVENIKVTMSELEGVIG